VELGAGDVTGNILRTASARKTPTARTGRMAIMK